MLFRSIVAVAAVPDDHVALAVRFCVLLLVYVPVAVKACVVPRAIDGRLGVTAIDTSAGAVTVSVVEPLTAPTVAVISVVPCATLVATPPAAIVAVAGVVGRSVPPAALGRTTD